MRTTLWLLFALVVALPAVAGDLATPSQLPEVAAADFLLAPATCTGAPSDLETQLAGAAQSTQAAAMTFIVCDGVNYPGCSGGSCSDPCCYCECRSLGFGPGYCSLDCCH